MHVHICIAVVCDWGATCSTHYPLQAKNTLMLPRDYLPGFRAKVNGYKELEAAVVTCARQAHGLTTLEVVEVHCLRQGPKYEGASFSWHSDTEGTHTWVVKLTEDTEGAEPSRMQVAGGTRHQFGP
jgi:hypothetical protein